MPFAGSAAAVLLPDEMFRNVRFELPIVVFVTRSAVALVDVMSLVPVMCKPPVLVLLVAAKPSPVVVSIFIPPLNVIGRVPLLLFTRMPAPPSTMAPERVMSSPASSPAHDASDTARADVDVLVMVPP